MTTTTTMMMMMMMKVCKMSVTILKSNTESQDRCMYLVIKFILQFPLWQRRLKDSCATICIVYETQFNNGVKIARVRAVSFDLYRKIMMNCE
jgi:hypothetical protein